MAAHDPAFKSLADDLARVQPAVLKELIDCQARGAASVGRGGGGHTATYPLFSPSRVQGSKVDIGGYYQLEDAKANAAMRPSKAFNDLIGGDN